MLLTSVKLVLTAFALDISEKIVLCNDPTQKTKTVYAKGSSRRLEHWKWPSTNLRLKLSCRFTQCFVKLNVLDKNVEALCDFGGSVSCVSSAIFNELKKTYHIPLETCTRNLRAANGLPIAVKGIMKVSVYMGNKVFFAILGKIRSWLLFRSGFLRKP